MATKRTPIGEVPADTGVTPETSLKNSQAIADERKAKFDKMMRDKGNKQELVKITPSPMYRPFFGNNMPITINGVAIFIPMDGQTYEVPKIFADEFNRRVMMIDEQERTRKGMSNVSNNHERYAGERNIIRKV